MNIDFDITPIQLSEKFIIETLPSVSGDYLKLYIAGLCINHYKKAEIQEICDMVNCNMMFAISAFEYFQKQGFCIIKNQECVWVEFLQYDDLDLHQAKETLNTHKEYNDKLQKAFGGKILTTNELNTIYDWTELLKLPREVCLHLITYCIQRKGENVNINYMHAVAKTWAASGVYSIEQAQLESEIFERLSGGAKKVLNYIGVLSRLPSKPEMELYEKWVSDWGFTLDSILMALKDLSSTANPSFKYIDKVLERLHAEDKTTSREISEHMDTNSTVREKYQTWLALIGGRMTKPKFDQIQAFCNSGFSDEIIELAFMQATEREKSSLNYVETILYNWKKNGYTTINNIKNDIDQRKSGRDQAYQFYKIAGFDNMITGAQIESFEKWSHSFNYDLMLEVAKYSKNARNANQYMGKIFDSFQQKGIDTKEKFLSDTQKQNQNQANSNQKTNATSYISANYTEQDFQNVLSDIDEE